MIQLQDSIEERASRSDHWLLQRFLRGTFAVTRTNFIAWATALLALWHGAFWSQVLLTRLRAGEWPHPRQGPPFTDGFPPATVAKAFPLLDVAIYGAFVALVLTAPCVILYLAACVPCRSIRPSRRLGIAFAVLVALTGITWIFDPFGFLLWFGD